MKLSDFDYDLPERAIAQAPLQPRDAARLLCHDIGADRTVHRCVRDLDALLDPADLLVVNDTRVRAARFVGRRASGGAVELLLLERGGEQLWRALVRPAGRLRPGEEVLLEEGRLLARFRERGPSGAEWLLELVDARSGADAQDELLEATGRAPLPPYIRRPRGDDRERERDRQSYQTVFARRPGAVAAPTAGLHFTPELLERLERKGVERATVTLHVGAGTFKPVEVEDVREHVMHSERIELPTETVRAVERCRARGGRVVAVGTTSVRVLESACDSSGVLRPGSGETRLFLLPGAPFRVVDALITNFHLPRSTLLMLVSAFAGRERVLRLYREAIEQGYRFYSYGDAMLFSGRPR